MLTGTIGLIALLVALAGFAWVGLHRGGEHDLEQYVVARGSEDGRGIGLSFLASGLGAWMLFAPPEVGARVGLLGVVGYAVAVIAPLLALGWAGRRLRGLMPDGHGLTEFVRVRFGRTTHMTAVGITVLYMLVAVTAELTAAGAVIGLLSGLDGRIAIVAIVTVTLAYTAYGGLRASLRTDRWQAWFLLALIAAASVAIVGRIDQPGRAIVDSGLLALDATGLEAAVTLVIAIVVTTLFNNGYWQRVWAATDQDALDRGVKLGSALRLLPILAVGFAGMLAVGAGLDLGDPPVPFFALLDGLPPVVLLVVLVMAVALIASSVDTLENGMGALIATELPGSTISGARVATVLAMIPATIASFQGWSVLRILLIADLLCAAAVIPVLLGLWPRATSTSAISGIVAGLLGAAVPGWVSSGSLIDGLATVTFANNAIVLGPFAGALIASTAVSLTVAAVQGRHTDLGQLAERVGQLDTSSEVPA